MEAIVGESTAGVEGEMLASIAFIPPQSPNRYSDKETFPPAKLVEGFASVLMMW